MSDDELARSSKGKIEQPGQAGRTALQHRLFVLPPLGSTHRKNSTSWIFVLAALAVSALAVWLALAGAQKPLGPIQVPIVRHRLVDARIPIYAILGKTSVGKSSFIGTLGGRHVRAGKPPDIDQNLESGIVRALAKMSEFAYLHCLAGTSETGFYSFNSDITGPGYLAEMVGIDATDLNLSNRQIMMMLRNQLQEVITYDKLLIGLVVLWNINPRKRDFGPLQVRTLDFVTISV